MWIPRRPIRRRFPPDGSFSNLQSSLSVTYEYVDDPEIEGGAQLRQPSSITATFQFDANSFGEGEVSYYEIQFASSADFNSAYILHSDTFTGSRQLFRALFLKMSANDDDTTAR